jgi:DNA-binding MarR family transcriptional regulator
MPSSTHANGNPKFHAARQTDNALVAEMGLWHSWLLHKFEKTYPKPQKLVMKIEEEIQQEIFRTEYHRAQVNLIYTAGWLQRELAQRFKKYALTLPQFNILRILRGQYPNPATIQLLTERMLDKTSNASRIVDKLLEKGLVTRAINSLDRRQVDVLIADAGLAVLQRIDGAGDAENIGLEHLRPEEASLLSDLLDRIRG